MTRYWKASTGNRLRHRLPTLILAISVVARVHAEDAPSSLAEDTARIVSGCKPIFNQPPRRVPTNFNTDGPLLGNGDLGVVVGGSPERQRFWVSKCDFWRAFPRYPRFTPALACCLEIRIPALEGASFHAEQDLYAAEVRHVFTTASTKVSMRSWTPATTNALVVELSCTGKSVAVDVDPWSQEGEGAVVGTGLEGDCQ
jgi:alpha-L-fucosidase 2